MLYELPGGIFRHRVVDVTSEGIEQKGKRWFHDNHEDCVFPIEPPMPLDIYEQLLEAPEQPAMGYPSGWMVIGEENGFFPYSTKMLLDWQDIENRQHRRMEYQEVGRQNAELHHIHRSLGNPLLTTMAMIGAGTIALMVIIAATALILAAVGGKDTPEPTTGLIALMGAVSLGRFRLSKRSPKPPKVPRIKPEPRWMIYLYDTATGKKKRYTLPFSEVFANIPRECWRYPVRTFWRRGCALVAAGTLFFWYMILMWAAPEYLIIIILLCIFTLPAAGLLGFAFGRQVVPKLSEFARPYCKVQRFIDQDGVPFLQPMRYTGLTGVDPFLWDSLVANNFAEAQQKALDQKMDVLPQFDPIVNRADDAYEDVHGLLEREDSQIPMSTAQKLQLGSITVIAAGSVFTAFFIVVATVGG